MLRPRQKEELHRAVLAYLREHFPKAADALASETDLKEEARPRHDALDLPGRWLAAARLQVRLNSAEKDLERLRAELSIYTTSSTFRTMRNECTPRAPCRISFEAHAGGVNSLCFHPFFPIIVTAGQDAAIRVWHYENSSRSADRVLGDHKAAVTDVTIDSSGKWLGASCADGSVKIWNFCSFECVRTISGHDDVVSCLRFIEVSGGSSSACSGASLNNLTHVLVTVSKDRAVRLWVAATGVCLQKLDGHQGWVKSVAVGRLIPHASGRNEVARSLPDCQPSNLEISHAPLSASYLPSSFSAKTNPAGASETLAKQQQPFIFATSGSDSRVVLWRLEASPNPQGYTLGRATSVSASPSPSFCSSTYTGVKLGELKGHSQIVDVLVFAPPTILACLPPNESPANRLGRGISRGGTVSHRGFSPSPSSSSFPPVSASPACPAFSPSSASSSPSSPPSAWSVLVTASRDATIKLWDVLEGTTIMTLEGHTNWVNAVDVHCSGRFIVSGSDDRSLRVWDVSTGLCMKVLERAHEGFLKTVAFSPRHALVVTGGLEGKVNLWDCAGKEETTPATLFA
eukprot:GHVT01062093.1.p1 GENE.GHVT01062093.1~~GHVT01062093.1.p1  ORF type:complete len:572 (+),score=105.68 GHVT01062093.1:983-2698(+)